MKTLPNYGLLDLRESSKTDGTTGNTRNFIPNPNSLNDTMVLSEAVLSKDWLSESENIAWENLQEKQ